MLIIWRKRYGRESARLAGGTVLQGTRDSNENPTGADRLVGGRR
jgi:hypothetical protein